MTQELLRHIDRLMAQRPVSKTALKSYRDLLVLMDFETPEAVSVDSPKTAIRQLQEKEGLPVFGRSDLPVDMAASSRLLEKFLEHLCQLDREDVKGLKKALALSKSDNEWTEKLFKTILIQDERELSRIAEELGLAPETLLFLGQTALRPSIHSLRDTVMAEMDITHWDHGYCPICGSQPDMAFFEKTGKRYLHCELCGQEWAYSRIKCPFCNTEKQDKLGYFEAEQEEGFRVYFCRECGRYIKTIDKKAFEEVAPLELENLGTLHLDLLARDHGFQ